MITPLGEALFELNTFDNETLGVFEPDANTNISGVFHTQNAYFPDDNAGNGEYAYFVEVIEQKGIAEDFWEIELVYRGETQVVQKGAGPSQTFNFLKIPDIRGLPSGTGDCALQDGIECCEASDCPFSGDLCVSFRCIPDGSLRFTLTWFGGKQL